MQDHFQMKSWIKQWGGLIHHNLATDTWEVYDQKGDLFQGNLPDKVDAIRIAKARGFTADEAFENEIKDFKKNMVEKGYVDINGTRYYPDGYSKKLRTS